MEAALESQGIDVVIATEIVVYHALQTKKELIGLSPMLIVAVLLLLP